MRNDEEYNPITDNSGDELRELISKQIAKLLKLIEKYPSRFAPDNLALIEATKMIGKIVPHSKPIGLFGPVPKENPSMVNGLIRTLGQLRAISSEFPLEEEKDPTPSENTL